MQLEAEDAVHTATYNGRVGPRETPSMDVGQLAVLCRAALAPYIMIAARPSLYSLYSQTFLYRKEGTKKLVGDVQIFQMDD